MSDTSSIQGVRLDISLSLSKEDGRELKLAVEKLLSELRSEGAGGMSEPESPDLFDQLLELFGPFFVIVMTFGTFLLFLFAMELFYRAPSAICLILLLGLPVWLSICAWNAGA